MEYLVSYDLLKPGKDYQPLWTALGNLGAERRLASQWSVTLQNTTPLNVANYLIQFMDNNDRILVTEMPGNYAYRNLINKKAA
jgi:hypothetical protein